MRESLAADGPGNMGSLCSLRVREVSMGNHYRTAGQIRLMCVLGLVLIMGNQLRIHPTGMETAIIRISVTILAQGKGKRPGSLISGRSMQNLSYRTAMD